MAENLGIILQAKLDEAQSTSTINSTIAKIQKNTKKLDLQFNGIDTKQFEKLEKTIQVLSKNLEHVSSLFKEISKSGSLTQTKVFSDGTRMVNDFKLMNGEIAKFSNNLSDATSSLSKTISQEKKLKQEIESTNKAYARRTVVQSGKNKPTVSTTKKGNYDSVTEIVKPNGKTIQQTVTDLEKQTKLEQKILDIQRKTSGLSSNLTNRFGKDSFDPSRVNSLLTRTNSLTAETKGLEYLLREVNNEYKSIANSSKEYFNNSIARQNTLNNAIRLQNKLPQLKNSSEANSVVSQLKNIDPASVTATKRIRELNVEMQKLQSNAVAAGRDSLTIGQQLNTAFSKFGVWISATTAFYASLRGVKSLFNEILEVNKQMTEITRVSNGQEDIGAVLKRNIGIAHELGNTIHEVNAAAIEFAKQGFRGADLTAITKVATLLSDISDLSGEQGASILTSAMKGFNIEASKSIHIADALNQIDNNFAISTKQLGEGMQRAAASAKTYGVSMEQLLGYETAIGEVTRESGSVLGNSLKTIFARITTNGNAINALSNIGINTRDQQGNLKDVSKVLDELGGKWGSLTKEQRQNIGVNVAGMYQQSRFLTLMNRYNVALDATNEAEHSIGSAMSEESIFKNSYQAKLNSLKNSWTELALALEKTFGGTIITTGIGTMKGLNSVLTTLSDTIGGFPTTVGLLSLALLTLTKTGRGMSLTFKNSLANSFKTAKDEIILLRKEAELTGKTIKSTDYINAINGTNKTRRIKNIEFNSKTNTSNTLNKKLFPSASSIIQQPSLLQGAKPSSPLLVDSNLAKSVANINKASAATAMFSGILGKAKIAAFALGRTLISAFAPMAIIMGVTWAIGKLTESLQKQREEQQKVETQQKQLVSNYKNNKDSIEELTKRYEELSALQKNKTINGDQEKELLNVQNQLNKVMPSFTENIDAQGNAHLKTSEAIKEQIKYINNLDTLQASKSLDSSVAKFDKAQKKIDDYQRKVKELQKDKIYIPGNGTDPGMEIEKNKPQKFEDSIKASVLNNQVSALNDEITQNVQKNAKAYAVSIQSKIAINEKDASTVSKLMSSQTKDFRKGKLSSQEFAEEINKTSQAIIDLKGKSGGNWSIIQGLLDKTKPKDLNELKENFDTISKAVEKAQRAVKDGKLSSEDQDKLASSLEKSGYTAKEAQEAASGFAVSLEQLNKSANKAADDGLKNLTDQQKEALKALQEKYDPDSVNTLSDPEEILSGVSQNSVDSTKQMIDAYEQLRNEKNLTAEQSKLLEVAERYLGDTYGYTGKQLKKNIGSIKTVASVNETLLDATQRRAKGELTAEQQSLLANAEASKKKIANMSQVIKAYNEMQSRIADNAESSADTSSDGMIDPRYETQYRRIQEQKEKAKKSMTSEIDGNLSDYAGQLKNSLDEADESMKKTGKSNDDMNDSFTETIYIANKYQQALDKINNTIDRQNKLRAIMAQHSKAYRNSLRKEIDLDKQKLALMQSQSKSLQQQIKSGNIQQYGIITNSYSSGGYGGSSKANFGSAFTRTSGFGNRKNPTGAGNQSHHGIDYAAAYGTGIAAQQGGKVLSAGWSNSLGNFVRVQVGKGIEVFYGHMSKILTKAGDKITKGQIIGKVGSTGDSTGNHVHYAVKNNGNWVNPDSFKIPGSSSGASSYSGKYSSSINKYAKKYGVNPALVAAIIKNESGFNQSARSSAGAIGLMQLMPGTARGLGVNAYSAEGNIAGGTKYISQLLKQFNGDTKKAVAAYNAGPGNVRKYGGTPPFKETQNYVKKVLASYSSYNKGGSSSSNGSTNYGEDAANQAQAIDQAKSDLLGLKGDITDLQVAIQQAQDEIAESLVAEKEREVTIAQHRADLAVARSGRYASTSKQYRKEIGTQVKYLDQVAKKQKAELKLVDKLRQSSALSSAERSNLQDKERELREQIESTKQAKQEALLNKINSQIDQYQRAADKYADAIEKFQNRLTISPNNKKVKTDSIKGTIKAYKDESKAIQQQITYIDKAIKKEKLSGASKDELRHKQLELKKALDSTKVSLAQYQQETANTAIEELKSSIQKQKELQDAAYDKQIQDLQDANDKKAKQYDKDTKAYTDAINKKLRALDDATSKRSFENEMKDLQKQRSELQQQLSALGLDDSASAQAKRKQIQDQLDEVNKQIDDSVYNRQTDLQKQALQDEADDYQKNIDDKKDKDDTSLEEAIDKINKDKEAADQKLDEMLNDDSFWKKMADDIQKGNITTATKQLRDFFASFKTLNKSAVLDMKQSWTGLQSTMKDIQDVLDQLGALTGKSTGKTPGSSSQTNVQMLKDWSDYLSALSEITNAKGNKKTELQKKIDALKKKNGFASGTFDSLRYLDISKGTGNSNSASKAKAFAEYVENQRKMEQESMSSSAYNSLSSRNASIRKTWGFANASYDKLKDMKVYHKGGVVGDGSNFLNSIAQGDLKPNEQIAKLLNGEVVINESGIKNMIDSMRTVLTRGFGSGVVAGTKTQSQSDQSTTFNITVEKVVANNAQEGKAAGQAFSEQFMNLMKKTQKNI